MNRKMTELLHKMSLDTIDYRVFNYFMAFSANDMLAELFIDCCVPNKLHLGSEYTNTCLGALFAVSVLPTKPNGSYNHFTNPVDQVISVSLFSNLLFIFDARAQLFECKN